MNPANPEATHVAVRDGVILGAGTLDTLKSWGNFDLDNRFADKVLMPGFIEGHGHMLEGVYWRYIYCGYFDRTDPNGRMWRGMRSVEDVVQRIREEHQRLGDDPRPIFGWALDPIYYGAKRMNRHDLDAVSATRPIGIVHASGHIVNANSAALALVDYMRPGLNHPGIGLGPDGLPTGELRGHDAFEPIMSKLNVSKAAAANDVLGLREYARLAVRNGVTTSTDLSNPLPEDSIAPTLGVTGEDTFPIRLIPAIRALGRQADEVVAYAKRCRARSTERLRLGALKVSIDGSIQGYTARLRRPGYINGAPNGLWYLAPETVASVYEAALREGIHVHTHTNGDQATELAIESLERALQKQPVFDHRFVLQHCQLASRAQLHRMKAVGMCANFFANHHYFYGDQHYAATVGPERAERMNPCRSAQEIGVPFTIHSDAPVTPLSPLHVAWCAVNRLTASGRRLGEYERISVPDALRAITLGAAYTLKLDSEIGTIECGKVADLAVLEDDPLEIAPERLKDVRVWGTVQGGRIFEAATI
jgi:predicted amidohydrolase YtcJ